MRDSIKISIPQPCAERWENFTVTPHGGFCGSCSKAVTDFTSMTDAEILKFFADKPVHACGRFRTDQLKAYQLEALPKFRPGLKLLRAGIVGIMVVLAGQHSLAQQVEPKQPIRKEQSPGGVSREAQSVSGGIVVKGVLKDPAGEAMPGTNIALKGSTFGTVSDATGRFEFPVKLKNNDVLVFSFIGYKTMEYAVVNDTKDLNIEMAFGETDIVIMGAVAVDEPYKTPRGLGAVWSKMKSIF